jgi:glycolate oxidase iron-sulfur subunit
MIGPPALVAWCERALPSGVVVAMGEKSLPVVGQGVSVSAETYEKFNACVHCGLCLPACPTYAETMDEADSPRGRIHLMKAAVDGRVPPSPAVFEHLDRCLVCRACEPACPSGVEYHALIEAVRPQVAEAALGRNKRMKNPLLQWVVGHVLPHPKRAAAAMGALAVARKVGLGAVAEKVAPGAASLATGAAGRAGAPAGDGHYHPATAKHRGSVVLLRGCVGSVLSAGVNAACVRVLTANGFDVHTLPAEPCCGAMAAHANDPAGARAYAVQMVDALAAVAGRGDINAFVSPIAGCGAQLKGLGHVLAGVAGYAERGREVAGRVKDVSEFLLGVGLTPPTGRAGAVGGVGGRRVTYHDPCHLAHAQRITDAPRQLLALVPGLEVVPLAESDLCCGAAGTYSLNQPEMAARLGRRKAGHVVATGAEEVVTANVGCTLQIARHLREMGREVPVRHVVEVLADAYE